jgi:hypothetical protein
VKITNSVALSPQANCTDCATATCRRNLLPTFVDRRVSRGQCGGSPTVVNLSFLDRTLSCEREGRIPKVTFATVYLLLLVEMGVLRDRRTICLKGISTSNLSLESYQFIQFFY